MQHHVGLNTVCHWPLTTEPRFDPTSSNVIYVINKVALLQVILQVLWFLLLIYFHQCFKLIHSSTTVIDTEHKELHIFSDTEHKCSICRPHAHITWYRNYQHFANTLLTTHMSSVKYTADIETIIHLIPNLVQNVPNNGGYGSCGLLP